MRLYDTRRQAVVPFEPGPTVRMYVCGITPYDATHLGHAATYLTYDVLQRRLVDRGHEVRCVRNITDVDDDLLRRAREVGVHYLDLGTAQTKVFDADMAALGVLDPWDEPRATGAIPDIRGFIHRVVDQGHAYVVEGTVYFDVRSVDDFGEVSGLDRATMVRLARERGGDPDDPAKRHPLDFVLWRPSAPGEPAWESPWGAGRPGWHVQCSALALRDLGVTVDLHGGGSDLVFPHHECEAAQSRAVTGVPFVRHWSHRGLIGWQGEKMSKSRGNLVFVAELRERHDPMAIRLALLSEHYRRDWDWTPQHLTAAEARLDRWRRAGGGDAGLEAVRAALDDDLDVPRAIAVLDARADRGEGVSAGAALLGITL